MAEKGFVYTVVTSRPGQEGIANSYILLWKNGNSSRVNWRKVE